MDVADPHQGAHVRLVRLGGERIAKEDDGADLAQGDAGPDDQVAAVRAVGDALDVEAQLRFEQRGPCCRWRRAGAARTRRDGGVTNSTSAGFFWSWAMRASMG